ncbi:MAG: chloride channel protein [Ardenticatenaceae bacterium]|nr:chloride channel protein [Anaerolineales bacterium]MCB8920623.1 chloride channel protein [Ardenticatenaceae bacterium]MCB8990247.1 chloride channel protein [Ardenticatenaceae bacterium]MCB9002961.1 chloride channel protein [Ardenticatenaceae bacterium]
MSVEIPMKQEQVSGRMGQRIRRRLDQVQPPDSLVLVLTAVLVGIGTGLGAVFFVWLLARIHDGTVWMQDAIGETIGLLLVMALAGIVVGFMVNRWAREAKGHGVPEVMEALALRNGRIRTRVAAVKVLASSLTIGSGGSAGREGPIVQVGAALGSSIGQWFHFSAERVRTLVACGAAAGIAATFNAPIAGAIFALEVILGKFTTRYFGAVVISSVSAGIIGRIFLSDAPAFIVPAYPLHNFWELPIYIVLGVLAALVAVLFIRSLYWLEGLFDGWRVPMSLKTGLGLTLTALVGIYFLPDREVLGPGLEFIGEAIAEDITLSLGLMASLLLWKLVATGLTLGSGNSGGVFAPALFMGAVLGGMVGTLAHSAWPDVAANPGAYAIVGMAAVFAAAARAPITAVLIVFEMSNDYKLILPLMLATVLSTLLAEHLFSESIYTLKLKLKGISLQRGRDLDLLQSMQVREAMTANPFVVQMNTPLTKLGDFFQQTHSHSFPVVDEGSRLVGMVSLRDYDRAIEQGECDGRTVIQIATTGNLLIAFDDEPLGNAIQRLGVRGINKMPVVTRAEPERVIGVIRRSDIVKAYNVALMRKAKGQFDEDRARLRLVDNTEFLEVEIPPHSPAAHQPLAKLACELPHDCVVVSIRRHGAVIIPHGDTVLQPGDLVHAFLRRSDEMQLRTCLLGK